MVQLVAGAVIEHVNPPGCAVTMYEVGVPPVFDAATVTVALSFPATAEVIVGVSGFAIFHCAYKVRLE